MLVAFRCPKCDQTVQAELNSPEDVTLPEQIGCEACDWSRSMPGEALSENRPNGCLVCGCEDLWRQKDFPQRLGLILVASAMILYLIASAYLRPALALGVLLAFALVDLLLFWLMPDVLVCYRCGARYRGATLNAEDPKFNLEIQERYRQEADRLKQISS